MRALTKDAQALVGALTDEALAVKVSYVITSGQLYLVLLGDDLEEVWLTQPEASALRAFIKEFLKMKVEDD